MGLGLRVESGRVAVVCCWEDGLILAGARSEDGPPAKFFFLSALHINLANIGPKWMAPPLARTSHIISSFCHSRGFLLPRTLVPRLFPRYSPVEGQTVTPVTLHPFTHHAIPALRIKELSLLSCLTFKKEKVGGIVIANNKK